MNESTEEKIDPLKPTVKIYHKEKKELKEFLPIEERVTEEIKVEKKEEMACDDELYEVEKVEVKGPEFLEVKPKDKEEDKIAPAPEVDETPKSTDVELKDATEEKKYAEERQLPEWEPVDNKKPEVEEAAKPEIPAEMPPHTKEDDVELTEFRPKDAEKTEDEEKTDFAKKVFLSTEKKEEEGEDLTTKGPEEKSEFEEEFFERKEEPPMEESFEDVKETTVIDKDGKIGVFKDIKSIDEETAVLLYDSGFTSINTVRLASVRDLTKKGIKKKLAKNIKKEIEQKLEESATELKEDSDEYFILDDEFDESEAEKIDKSISERAFIEDEKDFFDEEGEIKTIEEDKKIDAFNGISNIDEKIASLLYENGITSIDILREKSVRELTRIKGIRRKLAKKIKKEIESMSIETGKVSKETKEEFDEDATEKIDDSLEEETSDEDEWESYEKDEIKKKKSKDKGKKGYKYKDYTLYEKEVETRSGKKRFIRFFSKGKPDEGKPSELPTGFEVKVNKKTGLPYLKKKK